MPNQCWFMWFTCCIWCFQVWNSINWLENGQSVKITVVHVLRFSSKKSREYENLTGCSIRPVSLCGTRWLEDVPVAKTALLIWPHIEKYRTTTLAKPENKIPIIQSFQNLKEHVLDPLSTAKL